MGGLHQHLQEMTLLPSIWVSNFNKDGQTLKARCCYWGQQRCCQRNLWINALIRWNSPGHQIGTSGTSGIGEPNQPPTWCSLLIPPGDGEPARWTRRSRASRKNCRTKKLVRSSWFSRSCSCHKIRMMDSHNTWHCSSQSFLSPSTIWSPEVGPVGAENVGPCGILSAGAPPGRGPNLWMTARHPRALLPT